MIAPKYSFTGIPWWTTWVASVRRLVSEEAFQDIDYLLPTVSKDFAGVIPRPSTPERALRWLKDAILRRGVTPVGEAADVALIPSVHPGLRFPDGDPPGAPHVPRQLAHGENSRRLRAGEAQRCCGDVAQKVPNLNLGPGRERREDLNHPDWADPLPPPAGDITDAGPVGRRPNGKGRGDIPHGTFRERAIDSLMVIGGTRGHTSEGQGPVSRHPGPSVSCGGGGQTHRQRRPVQNPPAE